MASRVKFRKLSLGPSGLVSRKSSVAGMLVLADYLDPENNQRTLLLERRDVVEAPAPKAKAHHKKKPSAKPNSGANTPGERTQTQFPGSVAEHG